MLKGVLLLIENRFSHLKLCFRNSFAANRRITPKKFNKFSLINILIQLSLNIFNAAGGCKE